MRVVIPYTARHPDTFAAAPDGAEWRNVAADGEAYWRLLREVWADREDTLIVEHDVVCRPDVTAGLQECPEPWCAHGYDDICHPECMEAWSNALGCTRFRANLMAAVADAVVAIPAHLRDWHNVCDGLGANLRAAGYTHHWHHPPVRHHHMQLRNVAGLDRPADPTPTMRGR